MRITKSKVAATMTLGAAALLIGFLVLTPSTADTAWANGADAFETTLSNPAPGDLSPDAPATCAQNGELQLPSVGHAESGAAAVTCVTLYLTKDAPYHCCAGYHWIWCEPMT